RPPALLVHERLGQFRLRRPSPHSAATLDLAPAATRAALVAPLLGHDLRFLGRPHHAAPPPPKPNRSGGTYTHVVPRRSTKRRPHPDQGATTSAGDQARFSPQNGPPARETHDLER